MMHPRYVPILKGKEGEFGALAELEPALRPLILPLIEVPPVPYDFANDRPAKSLDAHLVGVVERLAKSWQAPQRLLLDTPYLRTGESLTDRIEPLAFLCGECARRGLGITPVIRLDSTDGQLGAVGDYLRLAHGEVGVCLRLRIADLADDLALEQRIERLFRGLRFQDLSAIDILIDLEDLRGDSQRSLLELRAALGEFPKLEAWRNVIIAAGSFPEDLSDVDAESVTRLPRAEWLLWESLRKRVSRFSRADFLFGDYATTHPEQKELDPRTMRMSASIRYTLPDAWLILKGRNVRQYGYEQYFHLSSRIAKDASYSGRHYSWGDSYIYDCSQGMTGPGNATTWRKVSTNHHLTLVARALDLEVEPSVLR